MTSRRVGFFASKNGSGMKAIGRAIADERLESKIVLLLTNNPDCGAENWASENEVPVAHIEGKPEDELADERCLTLLRQAGVDLIVLSGFLRKLGPRVLAEFSPNILNVHPALLPKFGGKGMYGAHVHRAVLAAGEPISGATVHIVDPNYDEGPVVARKEILVAADENPESLAGKVMVAEQKLLIEVLTDLENGLLTLQQFG